MALNSEEPDPVRAKLYRRGMLMESRLTGWFPSYAGGLNMSSSTTGLFSDGAHGITAEVRLE